MPSQLQVKKMLAQKRKSLPHRMSKMAANIQLQAKIRLEMDKQLRRAELAHIQHQLNLCYGLLCALPVLIALVILSWRRYGGIISATQARDGEGAGRSRGNSVDKKNT